MANATMMEELGGGILVSVDTKEENEVESEVERHFEAAVVLNEKRQQLNSILEEQQKDEKAGKEEKEEKEQEEAEQRRLHMHRGGDQKSKVKYCLCRGILEAVTDHRITFISSQIVCKDFKLKLFGTYVYAWIYCMHIISK